MNHHELVELAALVATHAPVFLRLTKTVPENELERYWTASKCRQDRWQLTLAELKDSRTPLVAATGGLHRFAAAVFDEIFSGEILARLWAGVLVSHDSQHRSEHAGPAARSVLQGHLEVRRRTLSLLSTARQLPLGGLVDLNRQRRACERWTDLLLAEMAHAAEVTEFAHEPERLRDFADDVPRSPGVGYGRTRQALLQASLRAAFDRPAPLPSPNSDLNRQIAAGVLGCFQSELFDGAGVLRSAWFARLLVVADDAETMLGEYLAAAGATAASRPGRRGLPRF
jgi:hypothetical protein